MSNEVSERSIVVMFVSIPPALIFQVAIGNCVKPTTLFLMVQLRLKLFPAVGVPSLLIFANKILDGTGAKSKIVCLHRYWQWLTNLLVAFIVKFL